MPRKPRLLSSTGIYHTVLRSVNQHIIFEEDSDYQKFLYILRDSKKKYSIDIYAYCIMDNHIHMLIKSSPENLAPFFQSLGTRFAQWYNNKYARIGHLFQDRYFSTAIENDSSFLSALVYIHNNPVKANICLYPSEYRFSSYNAYYGAKNPLVNISYAHDIVGSREELQKYFSNPTPSNQEDLIDVGEQQKLFYTTDENAIQIFKDVTHLNSVSEIAHVNKVQRNAFIRELRDRGVTVKQIARIIDVSPKTVTRICKMSPPPRPLGTFVEEID